ncbi:MAG TPA: helix-turn-helix domain-containing protein [Sphingobium sp.]
MPDLIDRAVAWVTSPAYIDFTTRQLAILGLVLDAPQPPKVKELAARLNLVKPVVTRPITVLAKHGFVERQRGEDRRDCLIVPTIVGQLFRSAVAECAAVLEHGEAPGDYEITDDGVMRPLPSWIRDNEATQLRLMLEATNVTTLEEIATWTDDQVKEADCWAWSVHLSAADHDDIQVPARPSSIPVADPMAGRHPITGEVEA